MRRHRVVEAMDIRIGGVDADPGRHEDGRAIEEDVQVGMRVELELLPRLGHEAGLDREPHRVRGRRPLLVRPSR
jgi:hypothetical protein